MRTHGRPTVANRHHAWPLPRRLPVSVPAACHGLGFRHATPQCRSHRRPNTQLEEECDRSCRNLVRFRTSARRAQGCRHPPISYQIPTLMHLQSYLHHLPHHITQLSKGASTTIITQHTPFPFARGPCRQGVVVASGLAEQSYQTLAKLPWNLSRRKAVGRMFHSEITIQEATRHLRANVKPSDGESLSAWPRTGREWPLPYPGTWRPQVNTSSVAARFHASRLPTYLPRLATAVLLCCGIEKTLCEARCKRRYPPPRMVVSAATDRATARCLHRTGYHNGDTTLARPRVPSLSVDRLAEADCPHGRRLAPPLDESPWAVPGARGGGVPACQQNHHVEVGVVVYRSRCNILPLRGQRDGDRFPTSPLHSISRRPVPPRLPPCSL